MSSCPSPPHGLNSRIATNPSLNQIRKTAKTAMLTTTVNIAIQDYPRPSGREASSESAPAIQDYLRPSGRGANVRRSSPSACPLTLTHSHLCGYTVGTFYGTWAVSCREREALRMEGANNERRP